MRQSPKEPAEQTSATLVLLFRSVIPRLLALPFLTVLLQLIIVEQHIPLKRVIRQIEQAIVIKHGSLPYRLASIHHVEANAHLVPRATLGGNLLHARLKYTLVSIMHHHG